MRAKVLDVLAETRLIAILRGNFGERLIDIASALIDGGVRMLEISTVSKNYAEGIRDIARLHGDRVIVGAGTVLNTEHLAKVIAAGASFIVSPDSNREVIEESRKQDCASFPGVFTPTEITAAIRYGADAVKVFPASALGTSFVRRVRGPLPDVKMIPTGGVNLENVDEWFQAGAYAVAMGSELVGTSDIHAFDANVLTARARKFALAARRPSHD